MWDTILAKFSPINKKEEKLQLIMYNYLLFPGTLVEIRVVFVLTNFGTTVIMKTNLKQYFENIQICKVQIMFVEMLEHVTN